MLVHIEDALEVQPSIDSGLLVRHFDHLELVRHEQKVKHCVLLPVFDDLRHLV